MQLSSQTRAIASTEASPDYDKAELTTPQILSQSTLKEKGKKKNKTNNTLSTKVNAKLSPHHGKTILPVTTSIIFTDFFQAQIRPYIIAKL